MLSEMTELIRLEQMRILVVDDSRDFRLLIEKVLKKAGFESVIFAESAARAFSILGLDGKSKERTDISLILMDIIMPGMDGVLACRKIKAAEHLHDIPLLMVTIVDDTRMLKRALSEGANDYITKPLNTIELLARIRSALSLKRECDLKKKHAESARRLAFVVEQSPSSIIVTDNNGRIAYLNRATTESLGYTKDELVGKDIDILESSHHTKGFYRDIWRTLKLDTVWRGDLYTRTKSGGVVRELRNITPLKDASGKIVNFVSVRIEDTERRIAEEALKKREKDLVVLSKDLHDLTMSMSRLEEKERKAFAAVLHEDIGQNLAALKMALALIAKTPAMEGKERQAVMDRTDKLLDDTIRATRSLTSKLYTSLPENASVTDAVDWFANIFLRDTGIKVSSKLNKKVDSLPEDVRASLLRIIRELFQNTMKHATPTRVDVSCSVKKNVLELMVEDDGVGFSLEEVSGKKNRGIGLLLMKELSTEMGGKLMVDSKPGQGTRVVLQLPLVMQ